MRDPSTVCIVWDKCFAGGVASACTGKEGFPTLAFEVSSDHKKRILSCSQYFWGSINDKTISLMDPVFDAFFRKPDGMYKNYSWTTRLAILMILATTILVIQMIQIHLLGYVNLRN